MDFQIDEKLAYADLHGFEVQYFQNLGDRQGCITGLLLDFRTGAFAGQKIFNPKNQEKCQDRKDNAHGHGAYAVKEHLSGYLVQNQGGKTDEGSRGAHKTQDESIFGFNQRGLQENIQDAFRIAPSQQSAETQGKGIAVGDGGEDQSAIGQIDIVYRFRFDKPLPAEV